MSTTCCKCRSFKHYKRWPNLGVCLRVWPPYMRAHIHEDHEACPNFRKRTKRQLEKERIDNLPIFQQPIDNLPLFNKEEQ